MLAVTMGVMWMGGIGLYGVGARSLGPLGPSLGWAMLMASMVLAANVFGLLTGEWIQAAGRLQASVARGRIASDARNCRTRIFQCAFLGSLCEVR